MCDKRLRLEKDCNKIQVLFPLIRIGRIIPLKTVILIANSKL